MHDPMLHLAIDNCFASKRWSQPVEWMNLIRDMGIENVEASADNEFDPLYYGDEFLSLNSERIRQASVQTGVKVASLYSGHGTYSTLGLAHTDSDVRARMRDKWLKPMVEYAAGLGAGLGFFCHAFADSILQDEKAYTDAYETLSADLSDICTHANRVGCNFLALEQMYTPHQPPFTIVGAHELMRKVTAEAKAPLYITIDTGHQSGQSRFLMPEREELLKRIESNQAKWLGSKSTYEIFDGMGTSASKADAMLEEMKKYPWLFAAEEDCDTYQWLEKLGGYSPIIHLQQTNGRQSAHLPFTENNNASGKIDGEKVLRALKTFYSRPQEEGMPENCGDIYLTLEIFAGTGAYNRELLSDLKESASYWRKFIPHGGIRLNEAIAALEMKVGR